MKKKVFLWIICLVVACVALTIIITTQLRLNETEEEIRELEARREELLSENERLEHDLKSDVTDEYIIRIMRKLGYYFPGEDVIVFGESQTDEDDDND